MDNSEIRETMRGLEQVWKRVGGADSAEGDAARQGGFSPPPGWPPPPPPPPKPPQAGARELARLIEANQAAAQRYRELSRKTRGQAAAQLLGMAAERSRDERALQEQYYLLTGDSLRLRREPPAHVSLLQGLRLAWSEEAEYSRSLIACAAMLHDPEDGAALRRMADAAERRRKTLRTLLRASMR